MSQDKKPKETPKKKKTPDLYESPVMRTSENCARTMQQEGKGEILSDVQGSYTGTDMDGGHPVQDADDL